jgi:hypothetical protein
MRSLSHAPIRQNNCSRFKRNMKGCPEEVKNLVEPEKIQELSKMINLAQRIQEESAQVYIRDKSSNGYDIDITELTNKKDIKIIRDKKCTP